MKHSRTISLFNDRPEFSQGPSSFVASIVVHGIVIGAISYGIVSQPQIRHRTEHYTVRHIEFHEEPSAAAKPKPQLHAPSKAIEEQRQKRAASKGRRAPELARQIPALDPGPQTLVQPKAPFHLKLHAEIPVPQVMIWTPEKEEPKTIVPPQPQPLTAADVEPSLAPPNEEIELASQPMASSELPTLTAPVAATTTSPIRLIEPQAPQFPPVLSSNAPSQPTPAAVLSLSELRMPEGTAQLPPLNETVRSNGEGLTGTRPGGSGNQPGTGDGGLGDGAEPAAKAEESKVEATKPTESKVEKAASEEPKETARAAKPTPTPDPEAAAQEPPRTANKLDAGATGTADIPENHLTADRITLPQNGQFGLVVVGSSMQERYPETAQLWSGRLAYTVYLHVGAAKNWILQYTLPRTADAATGGNISRIEAPWPYNIVRPNLPAEAINADALMLHGFVNAEGRFEELSIAFPPDFAFKQFVLDSLAQWQFRPAMQNGKKTRVEVLLIIPEIQ